MVHNKIINLIIDYIYSDEQLNKIFNHHNQKYTLNKLLYNNIPYREIQNYIYIYIHWCIHAFCVPMNEKINKMIIFF